MTDRLTFLGIALGVFIAVLYPVLYGFVRKQFPPLAGRVFPPWLKKYAALFAFSLVTALIVLALFRTTNPDTQVNFWGALALGFGWEASVEKFIRPNP